MIGDCTAVVFAGGKSQRMGQDKAGIVLDENGDETLLQRAIATVRPLFAEVVVSVAHPRADLSLRQVCDGIGDAGPLAGLCSALAQTRTPWIFALATDLPFVAPALILALAARRENPDAAKAVVPISGGYPQPLLAFYSRAGLAELQMQLQNFGKRSVRAALAELEVRYVDEAELRASDPGLRSFFDLDTPQDLAAARQLPKVNT